MSIIQKKLLCCKNKANFGNNKNVISFKALNENRKENITAHQY